MKKKEVYVTKLILSDGTELNMENSSHIAIVNVGGDMWMTSPSVQEIKHLALLSNLAYQASTAIVIREENKCTWDEACRIHDELVLMEKKEKEFKSPLEDKSELN